jgi:hypothetical protein
MKLAGIVKFHLRSAFSTKVICRVVHHIFSVVVSETAVRVLTGLGCHVVSEKVIFFIRRLYQFICKFDDFLLFRVNL